MTATPTARARWALFRIRGFSIGLVTNVMTSFVMFGVSLLLALYLQLALGLSPPWPRC